MNKNKLMIGALMTALCSTMPMGGQRFFELRRGHGLVTEETSRKKEKRINGRFVSLAQIRKKENRRRSYERCLQGQGLGFLI